MAVWRSLMVSVMCNCSKVKSEISKHFQERTTSLSRTRCPGTRAPPSWRRSTPTTSRLSGRPRRIRRRGEQSPHPPASSRNLSAKNPRPPHPVSPPPPRLCPPPPRISLPSPRISLPSPRTCHPPPRICHMQPRISPPPPRTCPPSPPPPPPSRSLRPSPRPRAASRPRSSSAARSVGHWSGINIFTRRTFLQR